MNVFQLKEILCFSLKMRLFSNTVLTIFSFLASVETDFLYTLNLLLDKDLSDHILKQCNRHGTDTSFTVMFN